MTHQPEQARQKVSQQAAPTDVPDCRCTAVRSHVLSRSQDWLTAVTVIAMVHSGNDIPLLPWRLAWQKAAGH